MMTVVKSGISHVQEHKNTRHHCQHSHISIVAPVCYRIVYVRVSSGRYEIALPQPVQPVPHTALRFRRCYGADDYCPSVVCLRLVRWKESRRKN